MGVTHARVLQEIPDASVGWIVDQDLDRAEALARNLGARATSNYLDALNTNDIDAVLVTTPTPFHRTVVELAAAHGKHVFCEKPIARTIKDAEAMIATCDRAGTRLMVGHVVRFSPESERIKETLEAGTLGQIGVARATRVGRTPALTRAWFGDTTQSGGVVVDLMIHDLDTMIWYFGDVERAYAHVTHSGYAQAIVRFVSGVIAHLEASWAHARFRTTFEVAGQYGVVNYDSDDSAAFRLDLFGDNGSAFVERKPAWTDRPYLLQMQHFLDRLADSAPFFVDGVDGQRALEAALAVLASSRSGRPIHFENGRPISKEIET